MEGSFPCEEPAIRADHYTHPAQPSPAQPVPASVHTHSSTHFWNILCCHLEFLSTVVNSGWMKSVFSTGGNHGAIAWERYGALMESILLWFRISQRWVIRSTLKLFFWGVRTHDPCQDKMESLSGEKQLDECWKMEFIRRACVCSRNLGWQQTEPWHWRHAIERGGGYHGSIRGSSSLRCFHYKENECCLRFHPILCDLFKISISKPSCKNTYFPWDSSFSGLKILWTT